MSKTKKAKPAHNLYVIGDVHGKLDQFLKIVRQIDKEDKGPRTIVQLGDLFVNPHHFSPLNKALSSLKNIYTFKGNHEYWLNSLDSDLGDFGTIPGCDSTLFVRGAFSIDYKYQKQVGCFNPYEELTESQGNKALDLYEKIKPEVVIAHDAPRSIANLIGNPDFLRNFGFDPDKFTTATSELLQEMVNISPPKLFVHGHFHRSYQKKIGNTLFIGLGELQTLKITQVGGNSQLPLGNSPRTG